MHSIHFFVRVMDTGKPQIKVPADLLSGGSPLAGSEMAVFSLCPHIVDGTWELSGVSFIRD